LCRYVEADRQVRYGLSMRPSSMAASMNGQKVVFVDLPEVGAQLMPGRPFGMVEGEGGQMVGDSTS
jgi:glycine cleavage system H lipoate-binding protein